MSRMAPQDPCAVSGLVMQVHHPHTRGSCPSCVGSAPSTALSARFVDYDFSLGGRKFGELDARKIERKMAKRPRSFIFLRVSRRSQAGVLRQFVVGIHGEGASLDF